MKFLGKICYWIRHPKLLWMSYMYNKDNTNEISTDDNEVSTLEEMLNDYDDYDDEYENNVSIGSKKSEDKNDTSKKFKLRNLFKNRKKKSKSEFLSDDDFATLEDILDDNDDYENNASVDLEKSSEDKNDISKKFKLSNPFKNRKKKSKGEFLSDDDFATLEDILNDNDEDKLLPDDEFEKLKTLTDEKSTLCENNLEETITKLKDNKDSQKNIKDKVFDYLSEAPMDCYKTAEVLKKLDEIIKLNKEKELEQFIDCSDVIPKLRYNELIKKMSSIINGSSVKLDDDMKDDQVENIPILIEKNKKESVKDTSTSDILENLDENLENIKPDEVPTYENKKDPMEADNSVEQGKKLKIKYITEKTPLQYVALTGINIDTLNNLLNKSNPTECELQVLRSELISLKNRYAYSNPDNISDEYKAVMDAIEEKLGLSDKKTVVLDYVALNGISMDRFIELLNKDKLNECELQVLRSELISLKNRYAYSNPDNVSDAYKTAMDAMEKKLSI